MPANKIIKKGKNDLYRAGCIGIVHYHLFLYGAMATGRILDGGTWYYLNASGAWVA